MNGMRKLFFIRHGRHGRHKQRSREELITEYVDGVLDEAGTAELRRAMEEDPSLAEEVREMQAVRSVLRSQPLVEAPRSFALPSSAVQSAARPVPATRRVSGFVRSLQGATAVAALLLVALVSADLSGVGMPAGPEPETTLHQVETGEAPGQGGAAERQEFDAQSAPDSPGEADDTTDAPGMTTMGAHVSEDQGRAGPDSAAAPPAPEAGEESRQTSATADTRSALDWAQVAVAGLTAVLALSIVGLTWGSAAFRR